MRLVRVIVCPSVWQGDRLARRKACTQKHPQRVFVLPTVVTIGSDRDLCFGTLDSTVFAAACLCTGTHRIQQRGAMRGRQPCIEESSQLLL